MENNRSPGPEGIPVEFLKLLDDEGLESCWGNEIMPDNLELAELVTLYKKETWRIQQTTNLKRC